MSVEAVAGACAAAASGEASGVIDGTAAIKEAAGDAPATGLTEALGWAKEEAGNAFQWAKAKAADLSSSSSSSVE